MMKRSAGCALVLLGLLPFLASPGVAAAATVRTAPPPEVALGENGAGPTGKGWGTAVAPDFVPPFVGAEAKKAELNGISYHGGPLLNAADGTNLYYLFYGDWGSNTALTILPDFARAIGGTPYFNINSTYKDGHGKKAANAVNYQGAVSIASYLGNSLSDFQIFQVVFDAIRAHQLPSDPNGVYFVLTSAEVTASSGFCTRYCGWHTYGVVDGANIKFGFIGNADRCPRSCAAQTVSPNGNAGADAMASIIAHELSEAVTDPNLNAWYDKRNQENADKCNFNFGKVKRLASGAQYNQFFGGRSWLLQQNWIYAKGGACKQHYP